MLKLGHDFDLLEELPHAVGFFLVEVVYCSVRRNPLKDFSGACKDQIHDEW